VIDLRDVEIELDDRPGQLGAVGRAFGAAGVSVEGGGVFVAGGVGVAHFLVLARDAELARSALAEAGLRLLGVHEVLSPRLQQDVPGQLGALCTRLGEAGVNIQVMYSDHDHQLVLVVDDPTTGRAITDAWGHNAP